MLQSEFDNLTKWNGREKPFYENYYLKLNDPITKAALWLRYTILSPVHGVPTANVWAIFSDPLRPDKNLALKETVPIQMAVFHKGKFSLNFGGATLNNSSAIGGITQGKNSISWDISWKPSVTSFRHFPFLLYYLPWPSTKVVAPNLNVIAEGEFYVNGSKFSIMAGSLHQGHTWGRSYSDRWAWANCGLFDDRNATLELLSRPPYGLGFLKVGNDKIRFRFRGTYTRLGWEFSATKSKAKIVGRISTIPTNIMGVTYSDPTSGERYCYNTKVADAVVNIYHKEKGTWVIKKVLKSVATTAFETVESVPSQEIPLVL